MKTEIFYRYYKKLPSRLKYAILIIGGTLGSIFAYIRNRDVQLFSGSNHIMTWFIWTEVFALMVVALSSTFGYKSAIEGLSRELGYHIREPDAIAKIGAVEFYSLLNIVLLVLTAIFITNHVVVLALLFFIYYLFSSTNVIQLKSIEHNCGESAVLGFRWFYYENLQSVFGYLIIFFFISYLSHRFDDDSAHDMIKSFSGGVAIFHLVLSSLTYSVEIIHESRENGSILDQAIKNYGTNPAHHDDICKEIKNADRIMRVVTGGLIFMLLFVIVTFCYQLMV